MEPCQSRIYINRFPKEVNPQKVLDRYFKMLARFFLVTLRLTSATLVLRKVSFRYRCILLVVGFFKAQQRLAIISQTTGRLNGNGIVN